MWISASNRSPLLTPTAAGKEGVKGKKALWGSASVCLQTPYSNCFKVREYEPTKSKEGLYIYGALYGKKFPRIYHQLC